MNGPYDSRAFIASAVPVLRACVSEGSPECLIDRLCKLNYVKAAPAINFLSAKMKQAALVALRENGENWIREACIEAADERVAILEKWLSEVIDNRGKPLVYES